MNTYLLWQIIPNQKFLNVLLLLSLRQSRLINSEHHDGMACAGHAATH